MLAKVYWHNRKSSLNRSADCLISRALGIQTEKRRRSIYISYLITRTGSAARLNCARRNHINQDAPKWDRFEFLVYPKTGSSNVHGFDAAVAFGRPK